MTDAEKQFLFLFRCHLNNENLPDGYHFDVGRVFSLAAIHNVLPSIYYTACQSDEDVSFYRPSAFRIFGKQVSKNTVFKELYSQFQSSGLDIVVLKGPVCALCYDLPDYRISSDFDIIVKDEQENLLHEFLSANGFQQKNDSYYNPGNGLYIEVSTHPGEGEGVIREMANTAFDGYDERCIFLDSYKTLGIEDNLVYLVYHAFKHFIGSGFGIRQLADIYLFVRKFSDRIDFQNIRNTFLRMGIMTFFENILAACKEIFDFECSGYFFDKTATYICTDEFITDLLSAGVFGKSSHDRLHSANLVLNAVNNDKSSGVFKTLFPPYKIMKNKFVILEKFPFLLPLFWIIRLADYLFKSMGKNKTVSPSKSIEIANSRIHLMKKMGITEQ